MARVVDRGGLTLRSSYVLKRRSVAQEIDDIETESQCKPLHVVDGDVSLATLHRPNVGPVHPCSIGKRLLRQIDGYATNPQVAREALARGDSA